MKTPQHIVALLMIASALINWPASAQLNIQSDGSDGALIVTNDLVIDLSQAVASTWNSNNEAHQGKGIYDAEKWAVVFKYSSVVISNGVTVSFANHPSRAPVVWLVQGDVTIEGTVSLDGQYYQDRPRLAEPGPGGFRGGASYYAPGVGSSGGFGPGGGGMEWNRGYAGSYGSVGGAGPAGYGNPSLLPLIGGSGGAGDGDTFGDWSVGGGAGGGAILIAAGQALSLTGTIHANGGSGYNGSSRETGGGSGGGIRLVANVISGNGTVQAVGGYGWQWGGFGRVRIERVSNNSNLQVNPDPSVVPLLAGDSPLIWMPDTGPTVRIVSIGGVPAPADPRAAFGAAGPDVILPQVSTTPVVIETTNVEDASVVTVRLTSRALTVAPTYTVATNPQLVSASPLVLRWTADVPVNNGYSAVQVKVVRP